MSRGKNYILFLMSLVFIALLWLSLLFSPTFASADVNQTLNMTVNITNAAPDVRSVVCPSTINLEAYGNMSFICNVTVFDYDNNTESVNATFFYFQNRTNEPDNKNTHYTNTTCTTNDENDTEMEFACGFNVIYFANNGTWRANATAIDSNAAAATNISNAVTINPLVAIYIPVNTVLRFGDLTFGDTSTDKEANITNAGNIAVNLSVSGYGLALGDNLAMVCEEGNIPATYVRYNITSGQDWNIGMTPLTGSGVMMRDLYVSKATDENIISQNTTFFKLKVPLSAGGVCQGNLLFTASLS
ncbi:MAG: hypothetical protein V1859_10600 [archaeon]